MNRTRVFRPSASTRSMRFVSTIAAGYTLLLALSGNGWAQEAETPLRLRGTSATIPGAPGAPDASARPGNPAPASTASAPASSGASQTTPPVRPGKRQQSRRTRAPTSAPVHAEIRTARSSSDVAANVQPVQVGLPDPAVPAFPPRKRVPQDDPYASLGIRVGNVNLFPAIGESVGYDSNPNRVDRPLRKGSFVSQTEGELRIQSDWSRHELTGSLRGAYNEYPSVPEASRPEGAGKLGLRIDVSRDTVLDAEAHYQLDTERSESPELNAVVRERPIVSSEGGSVGVTQRFNRLALTLRGTIDRTDFQSAILSNGSVLDQGDRAFTQYGGRIRLAYEFSPAFTPFVEGLGDLREYDRRFDRAGFQRSSDAAGARAGATLELTRLVTGEISAGMIQRRYDDPRLKNLTSPLVNASLVWTVTPLTTVRAGAETRVDETTVVGARGIMASRASLEVAHDLRRNLTITPGVNIFENDYQGVPITERGYGASVKLDYRLTRSIAVRASYIFERLKSSLPGSDYTANVFLVGMRFQP